MIIGILLSMEKATVLDATLKQWCACHGSKYFPWFLVPGSGFTDLLLSRKCVDDLFQANDFNH